MKKTFIILATTLISSLSMAQDFKKNITTAQNSYKAGELQDTHFALLQMMQDLDITIGKEVLKLFPANMDSLQAVPKEENVFGSNQFAGVTIEKKYGLHAKKGELSIVINSPVLNTINTYINSPMMAGFSSDPNTKIVKVGNYKAKLMKDNDDQSTYTLEIPLSNALLTLKISNSSENELLSMASTIPIAKMASLVQ